LTHRVTFTAVLLALSAAAPVQSSAQTPTMPSTLRYGSGLVDVPVSSVMRHLQVTGTLSTLWVQLPRRVEIGESGQPSGYGPGRDDIMADGSVAVGLFDRGEVGFTLQSLNAAEEGGNMWGVFGRLRLWEPVDQGVGLAVGGRYVTSPTFGDGVELAPGRLGFPDERLRRTYTSVPGMSSNLSLYAVATAYVRGYDGGPLPENDLTLSLGYGGGTFREGGELDFYSEGRGGGWFAGTSLHLGFNDRTRLTLMAEHNGFDVNVGAQVDWAGVRLGAQYLALNHSRPLEGHESEYMKPKLGLVASLAVCLDAPGFRCRPTGMRRTEPDTIYFAAPPPDTVVVQVGEVAEPEGTPSSICLATGQNVSIRVTVVGDTLVGADAVPLRDLRPGLEFAGAYAGDAFWYQDDRVIVFEGGDFGKSNDTFPVDCDQILRVGMYEGVPVFAVISARRPLDVIFVPVRPGLWQRYERGLRREPEGGGTGSP
jgi:hypothetical protein